MLAAHAALAADDFDFLIDFKPGEPWAGYLRRVEDQRNGLNLPAGWVPGTFLLAVAGPGLVGRASIRHEFNDYLATFGGHIGYCVVPEQRRRGCATEILRKAIIIAHSVGVDSVLVTCDKDNVASAKVIERAGGIFDGVVEQPDGGAPKRRYWIN